MNASEIPIYDVKTVREDFPILSSKVYGNPLIYFDNAASAQKPHAVLDAIHNTYSSSYANVHRGMHFLSNRATQLYEESRETVRRFIGAKNLEEIVFTSGATASLNLISYGYGMPFIGSGDEIVLSVMEHHSNIVPWHFIRERKGARLVWLPVDENGVFRLEDFEQLLTSRTKLVAITHMSNILGAVTPIKDLVKIAHQKNIPVLVDGSQAAVHMPVDVCDLDCDFYVFTGHKIYAPSGIGVLYAKKHIFETMQPFHGGGEMIYEVTQESVTYNDLPYRFEAGTPPIVQAIGLSSALHYIENLGREKIAAHEADLVQYAHNRLSRIDRLRILGFSSQKGPIVSFNIEGVHAQDIAILLDRKGIAVRAGTHCAQTLLNHFGLSSSCRASFALYNTREEIDVFSQALQDVIRFF